MRAEPQTGPHRRGASLRTLSRPALAAALAELVRRAMCASRILRFMADVERIEAQVRGRVQMVGFRAFVVDRARMLGVNGTVTNRPDGSVEVIAEGPPSALDQLLQALRQGPPAASVQAVEVVHQPPRGNLLAMRIA